MRLTKRKKVKNYYKKNRTRNKTIKNKSRKNDKKSNKRNNKITTHHYGGAFFTKKVKQLAKPLQEEPRDFSNSELAKTYLDRALPIYKEENEKFKHLKGMTYYNPLNMTEEDIQLALQKDNHMAMNLNREYLLYFLKMCRKHNFRPIYTAWYRTFEHEHINQNYEITDNRTWNNEIGGFMNLWITMTGDEKPSLLYILEDLEIVAKYYFIKNRTKGDKLFKYLQTIFDKYSSNTPIGKYTGNIYDDFIKEFSIRQGVEIENIDEFINMRLQNIANSKDLTKVKVASYLRKFNSVKVDIINKIYDNVTELQAEHANYYNLPHIKNVKDRETTSFINREKDFMNVLKNEKLNPSDLISPLEPLKSIDLFGSRKISYINTDELPHNNTNTDELPKIDTLRQTLHDLPSFLQENKKNHQEDKQKSRKQSKSIKPSRSNVRSRSNTL